MGKLIKIILPLNYFKYFSNEYKNKGLLFTCNKNLCNVLHYGNLHEACAFNLTVKL